MIVSWLPSCPLPRVVGRPQEQVSLYQGKSKALDHGRGLEDGISGMASHQPYNPYRGERAGGRVRGDGWVESERENRTEKEMCNQPNNVRMHNYVSIQYLVIVS